MTQKIALTGARIFDGHAYHDDSALLLADGIIAGVVLNDEVPAGFGHILLAGGLLAPVSGVLPTVGAAYVAKAFITVISGGTAILAGTAAASSLFGSVNQLLTYFTTPVIGEAGLLAAAILLLRVLPHGITGKLFRGSL